MNAFIQRDLGLPSQDLAGPADIGPALLRAKEKIKDGRPALVNVVTDFTARATTVRFTKTVT